MNLKTILTSVLGVLISVGSAQAQGIHRTACNGNIERLDSLLVTTPIDTLDEVGRTPLLYATGCRSGGEAFNFLMDRGANPNIADSNGLSPLGFVVQQRDTLRLERLLAVNADVNIVPGLLHTAVLNNDLFFTKNLIDEETDINAANDRGATALEIAFREEFEEVAKFLLGKGADRSKVRKFEYKGEFFSEPVPGSEPLMFAPGVVSTENFVHSGVFHPNGNEFYYTLESANYNFGTIMISKRIDGIWTKPVPSDIEGDYREIDPFITADGMTMYYNSNRPVPGVDTLNGSADIWKVERIGDSWGMPIYLGEEVNNEYHNWYPTIAKSGRLYYTSGPNQNGDIHYSELKDGVYQAPISLGDSVNSDAHDYDPFIAPDESYVIFASNRSDDNLGGNDLYISFRKEDGTWTKAKNMGEGINTTRTDYAPAVTRDGRFLFYTSNKAGNSDIYWVDASVIESLRN